MAYYAGQSISDTLALRDWDDLPFTLDASVATTELTVTHESGTAITPVLISNYTPQGTYLVTFRTRRDLPGVYSLSAVAANTGWAYAQTYQVLPVEQAGLLPEIGASGVIFSDLRARIAHQLQDLRELNATRDGDRLSFYDQNVLTDSLNQYVGTAFVMINGLESGNTGQRRRVIGSSGSVYNVQFDRALPAITREGDVAHLFNLRGEGFLPDAYDTAIRSVISEAYPTFLIEIERVASSFPSDTRRVAIPEEFIAVHSVYLDDDSACNDLRRVPYAGREGRYRSGFSVDRASREIVVNGSWHEAARGMDYRIGGYARHPIPKTDNDYVIIPEMWLRLETSSRMASRRRGDTESAGWAVDWGNAARQERGNIYTPRKPGTIFL